MKLCIRLLRVFLALTFLLAACGEPPPLPPNSSFSLASKSLALRLFEFIAIVPSLTTMPVPSSSAAIRAASLAASLAETESTWMPTFKPSISIISAESTRPGSIENCNRSTSLLKLLALSIAFWKRAGSSAVEHLTSLRSSLSVEVSTCDNSSPFSPATKETRVPSFLLSISSRNCSSVLAAFWVVSHP